MKNSLPILTANVFTLYIMLNKWLFVTTMHNFSFRFRIVHFCTWFKRYGFKFSNSCWYIVRNSQMQQNIWLQISFLVVLLGLHIGNYTIIKKTTRGSKIFGFATTYLVYGQPQAINPLSQYINQYEHLCKVVQQMFLIIINLYLNDDNVLDYSKVCCLYLFW